MAKIGVGYGGVSSSGIPSRVAYASAHPIRKVPPIVHWTFLLFILASPFEALGTDLASGSLSFARISGTLFFACFFFFYNPSIRKRSLPRVPNAMWFFLAYVAVFSASGLFFTSYLSAVIKVIIKLVELILLFWTASHLLKDARFAKKALLVFAIGTAVLATGSLLGLPGFSAHTVSGTERETALGYNPNTLASLIALAVVMLVGFCLNPSLRSGKTKALFMALMVPLLANIVLTGSRGGMLALGLGCSIYVVSIPQLKLRLAAIVLATLVIGGMAYFVSTNPYILERWQETLYEGRSAGREEIYREGLEMFFERPFNGWQPVQFYYELGRRVGKIWGTRDAHNLFLHLVLEVGLLGFIPFMAGLFLCFRAAWKTRSGPLGSIPLALLVTMIMANMAGTFLEWRSFWFVLAVAVASSVSAGNRMITTAANWPISHRRT